MTSSATASPTEIQYPYALCNSTRAVVFAHTSEKRDGPFACLSCNKELILRKGTIRVAHFAHATPTSGGTSKCTASSESKLHFAVKHWVAHNLDRCEFVQLCRTPNCNSFVRRVTYSSGVCKSIVERRMKTVSAAGGGDVESKSQYVEFVLDVGVERRESGGDGVLCAAIEVRHTHAVPVDKRHALVRMFGDENVHEIAAIQVGRYMERAPQRCYTLHDICPTTKIQCCVACVQRFAQMEAEEEKAAEHKRNVERVRKEEAALQRAAEAKLGYRECVTCRRWSTAIKFATIDNLECNVCKETRCTNERTRHADDKKKQQRPCLHCKKWNDKRTMTERKATEHDESDYPTVYICGACYRPCPNCDEPMELTEFELFRRCRECNDARRTGECSRCHKPKPNDAWPMCYPCAQTAARAAARVAKKTVRRASSDPFPDDGSEGGFAPAKRTVRKIANPFPDDGSED